MRAPFQLRQALNFGHFCLEAPVVQGRRQKSTLAAIHHGLHRSERPQGYTSRNTRTSGRGIAPAASTRENARSPPSLRIRKGKKDITDKPGPRPKSRKSRFFDPNDSFGKRSLVYQLKTGLLKPDNRGERRDQARTAGERQEWDGGGSSSGKTRGGTRPTRETPTEDSFRRDPFRSARSRSDPFKSDPTRRDSFRNDRTRSDRTGSDPFQTRDQPDRTWNTEDGASGPRGRKSSFPLSIPYTTAASQFLYGRSVVKAALQASQRKLYKLYIYRGGAKEHDEEDRLIQTMARRNGVEIQLMDGDGVRLMDKMSESRPHNGYVLEASPVPQLPVTSLGTLNKDDATKPGFSVELGQQSPEERLVNGSSNFITASGSSQNPFVLALDQVLDPGNLGAILRTASFLGADAVAISKRSSASMTSTAVKASSGASETLKLLSVAAMGDFLAQSRANGWKIYAAVPDGSMASRWRRRLNMSDIESENPLAAHPSILLLGSEGAGLPRMIRDKADFEVTIPNHSGSGIVDSLNVSVAAGILCAAFLKQKALPARAKKGSKSSRFESSKAESDKDEGDSAELW